MFININSDAVVRHTATLERISRSALPVAVRQTLNMTAMNVKQKTMPLTSELFVHRNPTFWGATSKVNFAQGFDINSMQSEVGFLPQGGAKEVGGATQDLEQQENAGSIEHRAFIPLAGARVAGSFNRRVTDKMRLKAIKSKIVDAKKSNAKTNAGKWFSSAMFAGKGGFVLSAWRNSRGNRMLMRIDSATKGDIQYTPVYSVKGGRNVNVKATHFMKKASLMSASEMEQFFILNAEKQIAKIRG
jgi:hypothetical protein